MQIRSIFAMPASMQQGNCAAGFALSYPLQPAGIARPLSPQVTERVLQLFLNGQINLCTHTTKIPVDIPVGESQNLQPQRLQEMRTFRIIMNPLRLIMLRAIQFNDQIGLGAVKVHDETADDPLFVNFHWIIAEKKIPKLTLVGGQLSAKPPGIF